MTKLCMQVPASANLLSRTDLIETWKWKTCFWELMWHFELFPPQTKEYVESRWFKSHIRNTLAASKLG